MISNFKTDQVINTELLLLQPWQPNSQQQEVMEVWEVQLLVKQRSPRSRLLSVGVSEFFKKSDTRHYTNVFFIKLAMLCR